MLNRLLVSSSGTPFRHRNTIIAGILLGLGAGLIGLLLSVGGPLIAVGALLGLGIGLYVLTNMQVALYATVAMIGLLPFATLPVRVAITPTLLDVTLGSFLLLYLIQWMRRERTQLRWLPACTLIVLFVTFIVFSFVAGLANGALTTNVLRKFAELVLSIASAIVLIDVLCDTHMLRRLVLMLILVGAVQALVGTALYALNDQTAERALNALSRFGYPAGGVIRYIEDDPTLGERAIGTWVDPNAYGGYLLIVAALAGADILAERPVTGRRWLSVALFGMISVALFLTQSRGAWLALAIGAAFVALMRYRWLFIVGLIAGGALLVLPFMQPYLERLAEGLSGADLATQMRFGEYKDSLILISRYPLIGVGFAGAPDRDIYLGVSNMYLRMANSTGILGVGLFALTMLEVLRYGLSRWRRINQRADLRNIWLGAMAGLIGALFIGVVDHYYFNIEFQAAVMMFWLSVVLCLVAAHLAETPVEEAPSS